jgi:hypothetical protein
MMRKNERGFVLGVENGREKWVLEFGVVWVIFIEVEFEL